MSKKRNQQSEPSVPLKLSVDPHNMFALRAAGGEVFLLDRNCVLVSRKCREYIESLELLVKSSMPDEDAEKTSPSESAGGEAPPGGFMYYFMEPGSPMKESASGVTYLSFAEVSDEYRRGLPEPRVAPSSRDSTSKRPPPPPRVIPFGLVEEAAGRRLFPAMDLPEISAELLEMAIAFMYYKYKTDSEAERRQPPPFNHNAFGESGFARLIAVSAILEM